MRKSLTAEELMNQLNADPGFLAMVAESDERLARNLEILRQNEEPLLAELERAGYQVDSVWDLVNRATPYLSAIPILMNHIRRPYYSRIQEGIARALAVPDARPYWSELVDLYRATPEVRDPKEEGVPRGSLKEGLAVALSAMAQPSDFDEAASLLADRTLGGTRSAFVMSLVHSKDLRTWQVLDALANEPDLKAEIESYRRRRKRR